MDDAVSRYKDYKKLKKGKSQAIKAVKELFLQAHDAFRQSPELADKYVRLARKIAMKSRARIPRELKRRHCRHCHRFLVPSSNCRVRLSGGKVVYYCLSCKHYMRFPYTREKKAKRRAKARRRSATNHKD
ncbi:ribonuclease P [Candidatus Woesearchaeota archaeon]|nr:ribonuclease P [Candidatus Woesearchaeota archaeon]